MSIDSIFKTEQKKTSCAGLLGAMVGKLIVIAAFLFGVAFIVWWAVAAIILTGWSFWPVVALTFAVWIVAGWIGPRK